ncbi:PBP1A family penicillin-binding protein [Parvularcula flava]|uniref:Penicillin-binding protein n=1 Tax=Aquisalinus luteolus TaxID=1566827 RepID=A0A8J3A458_9PROT|nr:PBP1A family penicillin-binding protein [Aquisalinus luteolus]NHK29573.1 PBP1A family penicillin-binding protein [Aquisalinus luteolus]GGI01536.1 penicillin-binding protein [Aquisalinus luteolus]
MSKKKSTNKNSKLLHQAGNVALDLWAGLRTLGWVFGQAVKPAAAPIGRRLKQRKTWESAALHASSLAFAAMLVAGFGLFHLTRAYTPPEDVDLWAINRPASITFLDSDGDVIGTRGSYYGDPIPVEELPPYVISAFLSTEDRRFYDHFGFDPKGFARAIVTNIRRGRLAEGASTITQQLARNLFLTNEKTLDRKLQELNLAFWLEAHLTKDEILSLYLNRTYLGAGTFGIEAASQLYFSKSARELTLSEAALLAGLPKAPSALAPTTNFGGATTRSAEVIDNLVETKKITPEEAEIAKASPPELIVIDNNPDVGYFFDYVMAQSEELLGGTVETDIVVTTTIDLDMQRQGQRVISTAMTDEIKALGAEQAALIAYDTDGAIRTMVGGLSYEESQFNRATQALRQPGSTFKPFVYLAALQSGMSPRTVFIDEPVTVDGWSPQNYSGDYGGPMPMTTALARSINTVAVQASEAIGRERVVETAQAMGIHHTLKPLPSIALGAANVTLDELTAAYIPFARGGVTASPYAITRIENRRGEVLYERQPTQERQVFDPERAEQMNYLLHQVVVNGTGSRANLGARQSAGKTGTTNDWRDAWFVGYTGQLVTGVWVGNDDNNPMQKVTGGGVPASIWKNFMLAAHEGKPRLALPGADRLKYDSNDLRLAQFYGNLQADMAALAYGSQQNYAENRYPEDSGSRQVVGRAYNDPEPARTREDDREQEQPRKRRGWWIFGRN